MPEVINSVLKRELYIIQYLYKKSERNTIDELKELVNVTEKTIRSDIKQINIDFPELHIETYPKGQIELICPDYIGLGYVYRRVMHLSKEIEIFEYLLMNPEQSIHELVEIFFISESYFRKIIRKWNQTFKKKKLDVSITMSPVVSVIGNERIIRRLYYHCLTEKYMGDFQNDFLKTGNSIWKLLTYLGEILSIGTTYSGHQRLSYWYFVCIQRMKQGNFIKKEYTKSGREIAESLYAKASKDAVFMEQFTHDYQIKLSVGVLLDILGGYDLELLISKRLTKDISCYEQKETGLTMVAVKDFLLPFYESISYENTYVEQTLIALYLFLTFQYQTPCFFYDPYRRFREHVEKESPFLLEMYDAHLENSNLPSYLKEREELKNEFLYHLVIYTESLFVMLPTVVMPKKILILTTYHKSYMYSLQKRMEDKFGESVSITIYDGREPPLSLDYLKKFDIILTDFEHLPSELDDRIVFADIGMSSLYMKKIEERLK